MKRRSLLGIVLAASAVAATLVCFLVVVPRIIYGSAGVKVRTFSVDLADLDGAAVLEVGKGCENLYLEPTSLKVYVTDYWGNVHLLDGPSRRELRLVKSGKLGDGRAGGIDAGALGFLYVAACDDRAGRRGGIYRVDRELESALKLAGDYPNLEGLAVDGRGDIYFATGNGSFFNGKGAIYTMRKKAGGDYADAELFLPELLCADGLFYDARAGRILFTETYSGVSAFRPGYMAVTYVLGKACFFDYCDGLCTDASGRCWLADTGGFLKCYDAEAGELTRYRVKGCGRPASCRIRFEDGEEVIYVTELKRRAGPAAALSGNCDGRGIIAIPLKTLAGPVERE